MNTRTILLLGTLLPLAACDLEPKDIGDPSGDTVESGESTVGYSSDGPNSTSQGSATSPTGADPTVATSTTGVDPTDATTDTTTTGGDPTVSTSTTGVDPTGNESTSMGSTGTSTTTNGTTDTTGGEPSTTTGTSGEEPGPVMCSGDPNTFPVFDKQCETKADCVAVLHTIDCCGSKKILGINADALDEFNEAEALCTSQEPICDCAPNAPVAEDGNSVLVPEDASLACNDGVCTTFVF